MSNSNKERRSNFNLEDLIGKYQTNNESIVREIENSFDKTPIQEVSLKDVFLSEFLDESLINIESLYKEELSIKTYGIVEPLLVTKNQDETFTVLNGAKRYVYLKHNKTKYIKVNIVENLLEEKKDEFILLNIVSSKDSHLALAFAIQKYIDKYSIDLDSLAQILKISRSQIINLLRLLKLSDRVKEEMAKGNLTYTQARLLLPLTEEQQNEVVDKILTDKLSVREIEFEIKQYEPDKKIKPKVSLELNQVIITCENIEQAKEILPKAKKLLKTHIKENKAKSSKKKES